MELGEKQKRVLKGMLSGVLVSLAILVLGAWLNPFAFSLDLAEPERLGVAIQSLLLPACFLAFAIGRLARHRFLTPEDIDGGGLSGGSDQARLLQSLLQNTLEQFALAAITYCAWAVTMPAAWLSVVPLAALAFAIGRVLFFAGYSRGAPSRAFGFTLSFYMSIFMLLGIACTIVLRFF